MRRWTISPPCSGFPGKMGMRGDKVWDAWLAVTSPASAIIARPMSLNTYLVFLRFQLMRGHLTPAAYEKEHMLLRESLKQEGKPHLNEFLAQWG